VRTEADASFGEHHEWKRQVPDQDQRIYDHLRLTPDDELVKLRGMGATSIHRIRQVIPYEGPPPAESRIIAGDDLAALRFVVNQVDRPPKWKDALDRLEAFLARDDPA